MSDDDLLTKEFVPCLVYCDHDEGEPYLEYASADVPVYYDRIDGVMELVREMGTKRIVGVRLYAKLSLHLAASP